MARIKRDVSVIFLRNPMKPAVIGSRMRAVERGGTGARFQLKPSSLTRCHSSVSGSHVSAFLHCIRELNRSSPNVVKTRAVCSSRGLQRSNSLAERTCVFAELQPWLTALPPLLLHPPSPFPTPLCPFLISAALVFSLFPTA